MIRNTAVKARAIIISCPFVIVSAQKKKPIATTISGERLLNMETVVMLKYRFNVGNQVNKFMINSVYL